MNFPCQCGSASTFWIVAIAFGLWAVRQRKYVSHGAWMIRAYAIAVPAGTLVFILLPAVVIIGEEGNVLIFEAIQVFAWPIHLAIAEWFIRRKRPTKDKTARPDLLLSQKGN